MEQPKKTKKKKRILLCGHCGRVGRSDKHPNQMGGFGVCDMCFDKEVQIVCNGCTGESDKHVGMFGRPI